MFFKQLNGFQYFHSANMMLQRSDTCIFCTTCINRARWLSGVDVNNINNKGMQAH